MLHIRPRQLLVLDRRQSINATLSWTPEVRNDDDSSFGAYSLARLRVSILLLVLDIRCFDP
jgi:hypothetical protein